MGKIRDAKTGHYLSEEEAASMDKATWVEEHDEHKSKFGKGDIKLLSKLYCQIEDHAFAANGLSDSLSAVSIDNIKLVFKEFGLDVDSERANGRLLRSK